MDPSRPTLYYDGRCGFCARWIPRWRQLTGDRVAYVAVLSWATSATCPTVTLVAGALRIAHTPQAEAR